MIYWRFSLQQDYAAPSLLSTLVKGGKCVTHSCDQRAATQFHERLISDAFNSRTLAKPEIPRVPACRLRFPASRSHRTTYGCLAHFYSSNTSVSVHGTPEGSWEVKWTFILNGSLVVSRETGDKYAAAFLLVHILMECKL